VPLALIITLVIMIQTATVSHSFRDPAEPEPDVNRDFLGVGAGNLAAALFGAFSVNASPPRTAVVVEGGSTSQLGALAAAAIVLLLVLWGGALLAHVPESALAGILLFVAQRIVRIGTIVKLVRQAPVEFLLVLLTAAAVIVRPIQTGVAIGISLSLLHGLSMTTRTQPVELQKIPGTTIWWPPGSSEQGSRQEGVVVIAFNAPLLFANAETFKRGMIDTIDAHARHTALASGLSSAVARLTGWSPRWWLCKHWRCWPRPMARLMASAAACELAALSTFTRSLPCNPCWRGSLRRFSIASCTRRAQQKRGTQKTAANGGR
jgi:MFS superfamily sulfate permease-like transporter